jgi:hypothetical protein
VVFLLGGLACGNGVGFVREEAKVYILIICDDIGLPFTLSFMPSHARDAALLVGPQADVLFVLRVRRFTQVHQCAVSFVSVSMVNLIYWPSAIDESEDDAMPKSLRSLPAIVSVTFRYPFLSIVPASRPAN